MGPLKNFASRKKVTQVRVVRRRRFENMDEQKWVQQMKSAQFVPNAELEDLARRNLVREMGEKGDQ